MPDKQEGDKSEAKVKPISRYEALRQKGIEQPDMPYCEAPYLLTYLYEIGPAMQGGMGDSPITHGEIAHWQSNTGITLDSWESRTLRRLSIDYLAESSAAKKFGAIAPYQETEQAKIDRVVIADQSKEYFRSLKKL